MESASQSPKSFALNHEQEQRVQALARSMSRTESVTHLPLTHSETTASASQHSHIDPDKSINPFAGTEGDDALNPLSDKFDINVWLKSVMHIVSRDPENFPVCLPSLSP